jgi:hypothetical protein
MVRAMILEVCRAWRLPAPAFSRLGEIHVSKIREGDFPPAAVVEAKKPLGYAPNGV